MLPAARSRTLQWSEEEDAIVSRAMMTGVMKPTNTRWVDLANRLPAGRRRTGKQVRDRWNNYLNPVLCQLPFSLEEDMRLWNGHKELGNRWADISMKIFDSTRSENHVKNRWYSAGFKKIVEKEFGPTAYRDAKQGQKPRTAEVTSREVTVKPEVIFKPDDKDGGVKCTPPSPSIPGDSSMLFAKEFGVVPIKNTKQTQGNVHWQQNWRGGIVAVSSREVILEYNAVVSDARKEGGEKRVLLSTIEGHCANLIPSKKRKTNSERWTKKEEAIVSRAIMSGSNPPFARWAALVDQLPGRSGKQIRDRWTNYLDPALNRLPFSREDDMKLWNGHQKLGNRWVDIGTKIFASRRSENQVKNRWYSAGFKKFVEMEFGVGVYQKAKHAQ